MSEKIRLCLRLKSGKEFHFSCYKYTTTKNKETGELLEFTYEGAFGECPQYFSLNDVESISRINKALPSEELALQTPQTYGKGINPSNAEVVEDYISRADAIEAVENNSYGMGSRASVEAIKALPSDEAVSRASYIKAVGYVEWLEKLIVEAETFVWLCEDATDGASGTRSGRPNT